MQSGVGLAGDGGATLSPVSRDTIAPK